MLRWIHRITVMTLCSSIAVSVQARNQTSHQSAPASAATTIKQTAVKQLDSQFAKSSQQSRTRRMAVAERASIVFTLFASELAWLQGQNKVALVTDVATLRKSQDPEVAERAMEMALNMQALQDAKLILAEWQKIQPEETTAKARLTWQLAVAENNGSYVSSHIDNVLKNATDYQLRYLFLLLGQASITQKEWPVSISAVVHKAAQLHKDMPEAMIADALYSARNNQTKDTISALQQLAILDSNIQPGSQITINIIGQLQPKILMAFFQSDTFRTLPPMWQSIYVEWLVLHKELDKAYQVLEPVLASSQSPDLYLQAVFLAINQHADADTILNYAEQAYTLGNEQHKNKVALMLAAYMAEQKNTAQARQWLQKITATEFNFDRAMLMISVEQQDNHWKAAQNWIDKASKLKQTGQYFDQNNLFQLQVVQAGATLTPLQYLNKLNAWLSIAKQQKNEARIANIIFLRGIAYTDKLYQPQKAVDDFRYYLKLRPESAEGLNSLGYTLLSLPQKNWAEAQQLLERAYQLDNQSSYISDSLGWAYYLNGDLNRALPLLQSAYSQFPNAEVSAHLGAVLWDSGQQDEARQIWARGKASKDDQYVLMQILKRFNIDPATLPAPVSNTTNKDE